MNVSGRSARDDASLAARARRGAVGAGGAFVATVAIGLASALVVSRLYGVTVVGEFALVSAPWTFVAQFSNVGEQLALIRAVASEPPRSPRVSSMFVAVLAFSAALTSAVALLVAPVSVALLRGPADRADLVAPAMALLAAYVVVDNTSWNVDRLLIGTHRAPATFVIRVLQLLVLLGASIAFAVAGERDVWGLTWATLAACAFGLAARTAVLVGTVDLHPRRPDLARAFRELPVLLRFGVRMVPGGIAGGVAAPATTWLIGLTRSVDVLGAYSRAAGLAMRLQEASYRLDDVLLPALSRWCDRGEHAVAAREFSRLRTLALVLLAAGSAVVAGAADGLLAVFGPDFTQAKVALGLLVFAYSAALVALMHHMFLVALSQPGATSRLGLLRTALTLSTLVPLVVAFGAAGAGAAFVLGYGVELAVAMRWTDRHLAAWGARLDPPPWRRLAVPTAAALATAWAVDASLTALAGAVVAVAAGAGVFAALAAALGLFDGERPAPAADAGGGGRRVAYVVSRFPKVTETFVYEELHALRRLGLDVALFAMRRQHEDVVQPRAAALADVVSYGARSPARLAAAQLWWAWRRPAVVGRLWWQLLRRSLAHPLDLAKGAAATLVAAEWARRLAPSPPDRLHGHFATWGAHGAWVAGSLLGIPYGFTGHAHDVFGPNPLLAEKVAGADLVVVISEYERRLLVARFPALAGRLHVVHCGVDLPAFPEVPPRPREGRPLALACVASLNRYKGHPVLLRALAELRRRGVEADCVLVGDGPERAALEALAARLGVDVTFAGNRPAPDVRRVLAEADVVVQPSVVEPRGKMEGIPLALMEALATGRPVVATAISGIPELVEDGVTGLLVPPGDAGALAGAIERLAADPDLGARLAGAGRARVVASFTAEGGARRLAALFNGTRAGSPGDGTTTGPSTAREASLPSVVPAR